MHTNEKNTLEKMIREFSLVDSEKRMIEKYQWFSLASGIRDEDLTLKLMLQIFAERH